MLRRESTATIAKASFFMTISSIQNALHHNVGSRGLLVQKSHTSRFRGAAPPMMDAVARKIWCKVRVTYCFHASFRASAGLRQALQICRTGENSTRKSIQRGRNGYRCPYEGPRLRADTNRQGPQSRKIDTSRPENVHLQLGGSNRARRHRRGAILEGNRKQRNHPRAKRDDMSGTHAIHEDRKASVGARVEIGPVPVTHSSAAFLAAAAARDYPGLCRRDRADGGMQVDGCIGRARARGMHDVAVIAVIFKLGRGSARNV